jgi:putative endonuclease
MQDIHNIGQQAESLACQYLEKKGLTLLSRNYRCATGEIDLVMRDTSTVIFVEVRKRSSDHFATPVESVNLTKQRKLAKTACHYLLKHRWFDKVDCRFDIIGISNDQIEWIQDAFSPDIF